MTHVIADLVGADPSGWPEDADVITLPPEAGWSAGRNAALTRATGRIVILVDGSVEARGDVVEPLSATLEDPAVGLTARSASSPMTSATSTRPLGPTATRSRAT